MRRAGRYTDRARIAPRLPFDTGSGILLAVELLLGVVARGGSAAPTSEQQAAAQQAYRQAKSKGTDFASGPCIAEQLTGLLDWSADVVHKPR